LVKAASGLWQNRNTSPEFPPGGQTVIVESTIK
jgi:hypothetical protein